MHAYTATRLEQGMTLDRSARSPGARVTTASQALLVSSIHHAESLVGRGFRALRRMGDNGYAGTASPKSLPTHRSELLIAQTKEEPASAHQKGPIDSTPESFLAPQHQVRDCIARTSLSPNAFPPIPQAPLAIFSISTQVLP